MQRTKKLLFLLFLFLKTGTSYCQEEKLRYIGVETGFDLHNCEIPDYSFIRGEIPYYNSDKAALHLTSYFQRSYVGVKTEIRLKNKKFALLTGLRYTNLSSSLGKSSFSSENPEFFYFSVNQAETTTEYYRVKEVNQSTNYLGIPIDLRYFLFQRQRVSLFLKVSVDLSYQLNTSGDIVFKNEDLVVDQAGLLNKFGNPAMLFSSFNCGAGIKFGKVDKPNIGIETSLPSIILTDKASSLVNTVMNTGAGLQLNIQIPF